MSGPERYRWLTRGKVYKYSAAVGKGLDERHGQPCRVLILPLCCPECSVWAY